MPHPTTTTPAQQRYIKKHYKTMKHKDIAKELGISLSRVQNCCRYNRWLKNGDNKPNVLAKEIIRPATKKQHVQPKAEYSAGHEATIEKYLKMDI
jgi:uncharacterized protein YjcR